MTALSPAEHSRIVRVLELVARSDIDGEVLSGVNALRRIMAGRSFADVWPTPRIEYTAPPRPPAPGQDWRANVAACRKAPDLLTPWEAGFLADLALRAKPLSSRQAEVLAGIVDRVFRAGRFR